MSEWGVCLIPVIYFSNVYWTSAICQPHAMHQGHSFMLLLCLSLCLFPAIPVCIVFLPRSDLPSNNISAAPKSLSAKQARLSFPILPSPNAWHVPISVLVEGLWQWEKQMLFQPSRNLQLTAQQTFNEQEHRNRGPSLTWGTVKGFSVEEDMLNLGLKGLVIGEYALSAIKTYYKAMIIKIVYH